MSYNNNNQDFKNSQPNFNKIDSLVDVEGLPVDSAIPKFKKKADLGKFTLNQQSLES